MKAFLVTAALLLASGGASAGPSVADADEAKVAHCTFLKDIEGRSVFGERLKEPAVKKAREDARGQAAKAGATDIVWGKVSSTDITTVAAKAYRCGG
ncbi:MAG TPA: hypothetical protein VI258_14255 [Rhodanobacteraceae bacterium]